MRSARGVLSLLRVVLGAWNRKLTLSCFIFVSPKACMSSCTRLSTAILSGILDCCCDFMLMKRQLKLYVFPSTLYLHN